MLSSAIPMELNFTVGNANGNVIVCTGDSNTPEITVVLDVFPEHVPPWVQVGNDADPDKRNGSFTENRQNWKRCPDAG